MTRIFIDTSIFAYALVSSDPEKQLLARQHLGRLERSSEGVVSTQVIQELYHVLTRKHGVDPTNALGLLSGTQGFQPFEVTRYCIYRAVKLSEIHKLSFGHALVISSAISAGCETVLTEDLNHGPMIEGIQIRNPFVAS